MWKTPGVIGEPLAPRITDPDRRRELLDRGAVFTARRQVRGDAISQDLRIRFDGVARYLQDAGQDHLHHIGFWDVHPHWVVRRTVIEILENGEQPDELTVERWAARMGSRWSSVRVALDGRLGTRIETEAFWINFNVETLTPSAFDEDFEALVGAAAEPPIWT